MFEAEVQAFLTYFEKGKMNRIKTIITLGEHLCSHCIPMGCTVHVPLELEDPGKIKALWEQTQLKCSIILQGQI